MAYYLAKNIFFVWRVWPNSRSNKAFSEWIYEFIVSPKIWTKSATLQGRNPYNFWLVFWEKWWLHKFIPKFTELYPTFFLLIGLFLPQESLRFYAGIVFYRLQNSPRSCELSKTAIFLSKRKGDYIFAL